MVILWWLTVLSFIFIQNFVFWIFLLAFDLACYQILIASDPLDPFGEHRMEHLFVTVVKQRVEHVCI